MSPSLSPISTSLKRDRYVLPQAPNPPSGWSGACPGFVFGASYFFWSRVDSGSLTSSLPACWGLGCPGIPVSPSLESNSIGGTRGILNLQPNSYGWCLYGAVPPSSYKGVRRFGLSSRLGAPDSRGEGALSTGGAPSPNSTLSIPTVILSGADVCLSRHGAQRYKYDANTPSIIWGKKDPKCARAFSDKPRLCARSSTSTSRTSPRIIDHGDSGLLHPQHYSSPIIPELIPKSAAYDAGRVVCAGVRIRCRKQEILDNCERRFE